MHETTTREHLFCKNMKKDLIPPLKCPKPGCTGELSLYSAFDTREVWECQTCHTPFYYRLVEAEDIPVELCMLCKAVPATDEGMCENCYAYQVHFGFGCGGSC